MPYAVTQGFIGHEHYLEIESWPRGDVPHERNSLGHRSAEPSSVVSDSRGYILVTGCSITEGVGLHHEQTWPCVLSEILGLPVYNLALQGTGLDCQMHNLQQWFWQYPRPKFLVRTDTGAAARFMVQRDQMFWSVGAWRDRDPLDLDLLARMEDRSVFASQYQLWRQLYPTDHLTTSVIMKPVWNDRALDDQHPGPESHRAMAQVALGMLTAD